MGNHTEQSTLLCEDNIHHIFLIPPKLKDVLSSAACELDYPFVAIQLPMMNEIHCCESAIECACKLYWPKTRLLVQVLDDSTEEQARTLIEQCVHKWADRGIQINIYRRQNRNGFKAGNLTNGMLHIGQAEYVAIFDVDFLPAQDYLLKTLPVLIQDPNVAFVQARWTFTNCKETLLTRMQEITLNFHHKCEQEVRFRASLFFTFNGTGGVWRTSAIQQIGGWDTETLVEDLDLSLRAYVKGWRSVYMHDVECLNELPPTVSAYLSQQYRWTCGPIQVAKNMVTTICQSKHISWYKKTYCLWYLFRSCIYLVNMISLAVIMPISIWLSQAYIYSLICICLAISTNFCYCLFTFNEFHLMPLYALFTHALSLNNACATISGLFNFASTKQWIVTPKFGYGSKTVCLKTTLSISKQHDNVFEWTYKQIRRKLRFYRFFNRNFWMAVYLLLISYMAFEKRAYFTGTYMVCTSIMYFLLASGCIGRQNEESKRIL
ncbi:unnamed protein product [Rotaria magnacalcarata]